MVDLQQIKERTKVKISKTEATLATRQKIGTITPYQ